MFFKKFTLSDIDRNPAATEGRRNTRILIIDDQGFPAADSLRRLGFDRITALDDIDSLESCCEFPVIICDVHGVGKKLTTRVEGGITIISQLKKLYPEKYIICCSVQQYGLKTSTEMAGHADALFDKGTDIDGWCYALDVAISEVMNPAQRWKRFENWAKSAKAIDVCSLEKYEKTYIKSVLKGNGRPLEKFHKKQENSGVEALGMLKSFSSRLATDGVIQIAISAGGLIAQNV